MVGTLGTPTAVNIADQMALPLSLHSTLAYPSPHHDAFPHSCTASTLGLPYIHARMHPSLHYSSIHSPPIDVLT